MVCQLQKLDEGQKAMEILVKSPLAKRQVDLIGKEVLACWEKFGISCGAMRGILEKAATTGLDDCEKEMVLQMLELTKQKKGQDLLEMRPKTSVILEVQPACRE